MPNPIVPPPVRPGADIRIVSPTAPSVAYLPERVQRAESTLRAAGFTVSYGRHATAASADGSTAGSAQQRASDLMDAFGDPGVGAIMAADAGSRSRELLEFLDPAAIAANPKPFIGFCDNVYLNHYLSAQAGVSSLYGATLILHLGEGGGAFPETVDCLVRALDSSAPLVCEPVGPRTGEWINWYVTEMDNRHRYRCVPGGWTWIRDGIAEGPLLGAEITMLPELVNVHGLRLESTVLFWHQAFKGPEPESAFRQLCEVADLSRLAGMVVGAHPGIAPPEWSARVSDMVDELLPELDCPLVVNADISHLSPLWTVPYGETVRLDSAGRIEFRRA